MDYISAIERNLTAGEKRRLQEIYAPKEVAIAPSCAWMSLCVLPDGEIRCYGKDEDKRIYFSSRDAGLSWKIVDVEDDAVMTAGYQNPHTGRWFQSFFTEGEGGFQGAEMPAPPAGTSGWQAVLSDEGPGGKVKWVKISDLDVRVPRHPIFLKQRNRVLVCANLPERHQTIVVARSDDNGESWQTTTLTPAPLHEIAWPHQGVRWQNGSCEATIMERKDGSLLLIARTSQDYHYYYESFDGGETWTDPKPTTLHGTLTMPTLLKMTTGETLFFFCNTQPLAEIQHDAYWPPYPKSDIAGWGEDVFTNRDANHCAISFDDGKSWQGFREIALNPVRNAADFRTCGGNKECNDKSVHQFQAYELPYGKVLLHYGQHHVARRLVIFDPKWLLEKEREENFYSGLGSVSTHVFYKSVSGGRRTPSGHCSWNRTSGAILVPDPTGNYEESVFIKANADERLFTPQQGLTWNFPAAKKGEVTIRMRPGQEGLTVTLGDHWFNPSDQYAGLYCPYQMTFYASQCPENQWSELKIVWTEEGCDYILNDRLVAHARPHCDMPNGLSYLLLQSALIPSEKTGSYVKHLQMKAID